MNDEDKACSYISYILSKQVKGKVDEYKQETFDMFQKLVNAYNTSPKYRSTNCSTNLLYVHSEMYKKMNKLYVLYEEYKKLIKDNHLGETKSCSDVSLFLRQYNEFIRNNQPTDTHYKYILDEFEKEIKYRVGLYNKHACSGIKYHIEEIRLHTSSENERHKASDQVQQKLNHMEKQVTPAKSSPPHIELQETRAEHQPTRAEFQATREETRTSRAVSQIAHVHPQAPQETLAHSSHHVVQQQKQQQGLPQRETSQREFPMDVHKHMNLQEHHHSYQNNWNKQKGDIVNLKIKFTPVGSFFGGRRRRIHQIPSSFRGFPPGEFPIFHEYEGGNIGYGPMNINPLAE
ncbi:PIR protein [Plasmodium vivax]|uniref:VIR protein n=1 Tax=Plasmodium vivax TaxID=5855 RepID=A0A565A751_PLAVI|nr:PIR protein [Plasmodium vivax]